MFLELYDAVLVDIAIVEGGHNLFAVHEENDRTLSVGDEGVGE